MGFVLRSSWSAGVDSAASLMSRLVDCVLFGRLPLPGSGSRVVADHPARSTSRLARGQPTRSARMTFRPDIGPPRRWSSATSSASDPGADHQPPRLWVARRAVVAVDPVVAVRCIRQRCSCVVAGGVSGAPVHLFRCCRRWCFRCARRRCCWCTDVGRRCAPEGGWSNAGREHGRGDALAVDREEVGHLTRSQQSVSDGL